MTTTLTDAEFPGLQPPVDATAILRNVRAILPVVDEEAAASNAQGYMTERMGRALGAAGVYRVGFSRRRGGPEVPLLEQTRMVEAIARRDASIAWNATVLAATGFYAGRLGDEAFAELYPELDLPTCGSFHPKGVARQAEGGYVVSGDWNFGSGIRSAHHVVAGVEVVDPGGEPVFKADGTRLTLGVWLPPGSVVLRDDWHTIGLRGSGSQGYATDGTFVPAHHTFDRLADPDPTAEPLNKHVELPFYSMAGISVGIAQHAVDLAVDALRRRRGDRSPGERALSLLGEADTYVRAARALVHEGVAGIDAVAFTPGAVHSDRSMARGDSPLATDFARVVLDRCSDIIGSKAIYEAVPFEQLVRDLAGVTAHISTSRARWIDVGRTMLDDGCGHEEAAR